MDRRTRFSLGTTTPVGIPALSPPFGLQDRFFFLGSCFAENLRQYWENWGLPAKPSPFGMVYNPLSLGRSLSLLMVEDWDPEPEIFEYQKLWRHPDFSTRVVHTHKEGLLEELRERKKQAQEELENATALILTFGTAYVYRHREQNRVWNNCHKLPQEYFERSALDPEEARASLAPLLARALGFGQKKRLVLTLSPVRHLRDRAWENSLSKALLRVLLEKLLREEVLEAHYFPAYEILLDELRDYRWYAPDRVHPSEEARDYIMDRFVEAWTSKDFQEYGQAMDRLRALERHKPLHDVPEHGARIEKLRLEISQRFSLGK